MGVGLFGIFCFVVVLYCIVVLWLGNVFVVGLVFWMCNDLMFCYVNCGGVCCGMMLIVFWCCVVGVVGFLFFFVLWGILCVVVGIWVVGGYCIGCYY